jgi:hypothetical protein
MVNQEVNRINTPVSEPEVVKALADAAQQLYGVQLSKPQMALLIAQNNLETGHRKAMFNYNIGNITHAPTDGFDYFFNQDHIRNKRGEWIPVQLRFRSYPTLLDGTKDYLKFLNKHGGGSIWQAILNQDPVAFSKSLKRSGYYGADEADTIDPNTGKVKPGYTTGIVQGAKEFNRSSNYEKAMSGDFPSQPIATSTPSPSGDILSRVDTVLSKFLDAFANQSSSDRFIKKTAYRENLLPNDFAIQIQAEDPVIAVEFARILCTAIDEELYSDANIHSDGKKVEVGCTIYGPKQLSTQALAQVCDAISEAFQIATHRIGSPKILPIIYANVLPVYQEIGIKLAERYYDAFRSHLASRDINNDH